MHSTDEAAEGNEAVEGRGRLEGMPSERDRSHSKGCRVNGTGVRTQSRVALRKIPASLGGGVFTLVNLREEPGAGKPHAGIREGEAEWPSYSTTLDRTK